MPMQYPNLTSLNPKPNSRYSSRKVYGTEIRVQGFKGIGV